MTAETIKRRVHLGCGDINRPYFINVDARPLPHVDHVISDITDLSFLADNSVDLIYASHVIEHVSWRQQGDLFGQFFCKLASHGTLRISVPDFDKVVSHYQRSGKNLSEVIRFLYGSQNHPHNFHRCCFNTAVLYQLFRHAGFIDIRSWNPATVTCHDFEDFSSYGISLNMEAVKP